MTLMTQTEWAARHNFSKQYAGQLVKAGVIKRQSGKINVEEADLALAAYQDPSHPRRRARGDELNVLNGSSSNLPEMLLKTRIKNEMERGKQLQLQTGVSTKELVPKADVEKRVFELARRTRDAILNVPDRVADIAATMTPAEVHQLFTDELKKALEELSK